MANVNPTRSLDYSDMIMEAIEGLNESEAATEQSISKYIITNNPDLPDAHDTLLSNTLEKLKVTGQLVFLNNAYLKPESLTEGLVKRGRGRPPKAKNPTPPARGRGRPPKLRDPLAPADPPMKAAPSSGRSRGRPRKYPPKAVEAPTGEKRGRGRPKKNQG